MVLIQENRLQWTSIAPYIILLFFMDGIYHLIVADFTKLIN
jgi:hypothetical protein